MDEQLELFKRNTLAVFGVELKGETLDECREELRKAKGDVAAAPQQSRSAEMEKPKTFNVEDRTVEVAVASELPVIRFDWDGWEYYNETLAMDGVDLSGAKQGIPLLNSHFRYDAMRDILGTTSDLRVEGDKLVGVRHFSATAEKAFTLAREGHLRGQSVGYRVSKSTWLKPGEKATIFGREFENTDKHLRLRVATKWAPVEDSIVVFPADHTTGMRSEDGALPPEPENTENNNDTSNKNNDAGDGTSGIAANKTQTKEQTNMENENKQTPLNQQPAATTAAPVADNEEAKRAATAAERARSREIREMCAKFGIADDMREKLLDDGATVEEARKAVMDELEKRSAANQTPPAGQHVTGQRDYIDQVIEPLTDAMCVRGGVNIPEEKRHKDYNTFTVLSVRDICLNILLQRGESPDIMRLTPSEIFTRAIATGDLPLLLKSTATRSLMAGWEYQDETYGAWTGSGSTNDLREKTVARGLANFQLKEVKEGQDYEYADMSEESLSYRVAKYGRMIAFTEEASINDNLDQITIYPEEMGRACRALEAELAYNFLINNPNGPDGTALFSSTHGNLAASGTKPTEDAMNKATYAMSIQKDASGKLIRVMPRVGVFPSAWRATVDKLLESSNWDDSNAASTRKNTAFRVLSNIVFEPRLDAAFEGQNLPWFIIGPANKGVCIVHLRGYETPQMTTEQSFNIDGFRAKIRHFCGAYAGSHQALYKNPGAALS